MLNQNGTQISTEEEPTPGPSQEGNFLGLSTLYEIPSWEGLGVGLWKAGLN